MTGRNTLGFFVYDGGTSISSNVEWLNIARPKPEFLGGLLMLSNSTSDDQTVHGVLIFRPLTPPDPPHAVFAQASLKYTAEWLIAGGVRPIP